MLRQNIEKKVLNSLFPYLTDLGGRDYLRELVRLRDKHICQRCKKKWKIGKKRFDVHHQNPNFEGTNGFVYNANFDINKMITLCHSCHFRLDSVRNKMKIAVKRRIEEVNKRNLKLIELYAKGDSITCLAEHFKIAEATVRIVLKKMGIPSLRDMQKEYLRNYLKKGR